MELKAFILRILSCYLIICTFLGFNWVKVYSHNVSGGFFPGRESTEYSNPDNPDALKYSILGDLENYRKDGVFHLRLCYPEFTQYDFPCNEWTQSSNFMHEKAVTDFNPIEFTFDFRFDGLGLGAPQTPWAFVDGWPWDWRSYWAIGPLYMSGDGFDGPGAIVKLVNLYVAIGKITWS